VDETRGQRGAYTIIKRKKNCDHFRVIFPNILLRKQCKIMQNLAHFQQYMGLPFENDTFQIMPNLAENLDVSLCTHLLQKNVLSIFDNKWPRNCPNVPTAS